MASRLISVPRPALALTGILLAGLALRAFLIPFPGRVGDMRTFIGWIALAHRYGAHGLYGHIEPFSRQPITYLPAYALLLMGTAHVSSALPLALQNHGVLVALLKAPPVLADLALAAVAYVLVLRWKSPREALAAAAIAAFGPWMWLLSADWGQIDSVVAIFLAVSLACALSERFVLAWAALAIGVLVKPLEIVVVPVLLVWQIKREEFSMRLALGPLASVAVAYLTALPFAPTTNPIGIATWLVGLVRAGHALYPFTSVSAFNVYTLTGSFFAQDSGTQYGLSPGGWGFVAFAVFTVWITAVFARRCATDVRTDREHALVIACFLILAGAFVLLTRMHERYLVFALVLAPLVWFVPGVPRGAVAALLVTFSLNCICALTGAFDSYRHGMSLLIAVLSAVNVAAFTVLVVWFARRRAPTRAAMRSPSPRADDPALTLRSETGLRRLDAEQRRKCARYDWAARASRFRRSASAQ